MTRKFAATYVKVLTVIFVLLSFGTFSVPSCLAAGKKDILVILRYDDFSSRSNTGLELNIIRALRERNMSCTFAVIPYVCERNYLDTGRQGFMALTPEKAAILREAMKAGTVEAALHGHTHQTVRNRGNNGYSEFSGLDYKRQEMKIAQGKSLLEGMLGAGISTFVPPFNSYDANTLRVLEKLDFRCLSANRFGAAGPSGLKYLPVTCDLPQLRAAVADAKNMRDDQPVIAVMFHENDFSEAGGKPGRFSFAEFSQLLDWLSSRKDIRVMSVGRAAGLISDLSPARNNDNKACCAAYDLIPPVSGRPPGVYRAAAAAIDAKNKLWPLATAFYFAVFCAAGLTSFWAGSRSFAGSELLHSCIALTVTAFLLIAAVYALHLKSPGYKGVLLMTGLLGAGMGVCAAYVMPARNTALRNGGITTGPGRSGLTGQESA